MLQSAPACTALFPTNLIPCTFTKREGAPRAPSFSLIVAWAEGQAEDIDAFIASTHFKRVPLTLNFIFSLIGRARRLKALSGRFQRSETPETLKNSQEVNFWIMSYLKFIKFPTPGPYKVPGTTMTIPNLAPSLISLLESSLNGQNMPLTSVPRYDEDENAGLARVQAGGSTIGEILEQGAAIAAEIEGSKARPRAKKAKPIEPENEPEKPE